MKAIILAAGMGSRLGHITDKIPKALINLDEKPLLAYSIDILLSNDIEDIIIVTGYKAYKIREFVKRNYPKISVNFIHNSKYDETNNIYSLYLAIRNLEEPYYILNSDIVYHPDIFRLLKDCNKENLTITVDIRENLSKEDMKVVIEGDRVKKISKEIDPDEAHGEYIGITKVPEKSVSEFRNALNETMTIHGKGVFYEHAFQRLIDKGGIVNYSPTKNLPWAEIDTFEDLIYAKKVIYPKIIGK